MESNRFSLFGDIASSVCARNLVHIHKLLRIDSRLGYHDAFAEMATKADEVGGDSETVFLVTKSGKAIGWCAMDFSPAEDPDEVDWDTISIGHICTPITPANMVSADTPVLELLELFATRKEEMYFVMDRSDVIGYITYGSLLSGETRYVLLMLPLQLERIALLMASVDCKASFASLPPGRRAKAEEIYRERRPAYPRDKTPALRELLECTSFCDKGMIIAKNKLLPSLSRRRLMSIFDQAEDLRNRCAHTTPHDDDIHQMSAKSLYALVAGIHDLIEQGLKACVELKNEEEGGQNG